MSDKHGFTDALRRLLRVSKHELDEEERKHKAEHPTGSKPT